MYVFLNIIDQNGISYNM